MFLEGDKVKVDGHIGQVMATVIRDDLDKVWVTLDNYDRPNPIWFSPEEVEPT